MRFLFVFLITLYSFSCELKKEIVSLSYPVTTMLDQLGLIGSKKLKAISSIHQTKNNFTGEKLSGGIFLAKNSIKNYKDKIIFYDSSIDLKNMFQRVSGVTSIEVKTRDLDPFQAYEEILNFISPVLSNCEDKVKEIDLKRQVILNKYQNLKVKQQIIFFMGKCDGDKFPETIIANDGFVKFLKKLNVLETYPTETSYVIWSKKMLKNLANFKKFCINTNEDEFSLKQNKQIYNINFRQAFNPGLSQIFFLDLLFPILVQ